MEAMTPLQYVGSSKHLQQYMRQLPTAVFLVNLTGTIIEVNQACLQTTGFSREELVGQPFHKITPCPGSITQLYEDWLAMASDVAAGSAELPWCDKDGRSHRSPAMIYCHQADNPFYMIHFYQLSGDSTPTLVQRFMQKLPKENNLGLILIDKDGRIAEISQMACKLLGLVRSEVLNSRLEYVFSGIPEEHRLIQRELLRGVKLQNKAMYWSNNDQRFELLVDSNALYDEDGNMAGVYVLLKDVTNLRSIEQKIERNERLAVIGQIAAGTAHEIRNPLTSIKGFLQMFWQLFDDKGMDRERGYTEIMLTEINRINALVSEFLLLSKPRDVQYSLVDLNTAFEELLPIVESQALLHGIELKFSSRGQLPHVVGDTELLKQVFLNICKNGIEAMGNEGVLHISHHFEEEGDRLSIDIHDTGPGIPPYVIDKIFDPFYTTKEEGTGLGLSVCQKIIHDIGGQIRVSSKGYGTTFHILLPYL